MVDIIAAVEDVFREKGEGRIAMPPKIGIDPAPNASLNAMPGYVASARAAGVKWVSIYAKNIQQGTALSRRRSAIRFDRLIHQGRRGSPWREICFTSCAHMV